jgi:macrolide-specific efflux system membrane fusion protein
MKPVVIVAGLVLVLAIGAVVVFRGEKPQEPVNSATVERVATVTRGDLDMTVSADGVVQPINSVEIRSKASGEIKELTFEEGDAVKKGDLLIALDQTTTLNDYEQAKADLELAEANQSNRRTTTGVRRSFLTRNFSRSRNSTRPMSSWSGHVRVSSRPARRSPRPMSGSGIPASAHRSRASF